MSAPSRLLLVDNDPVFLQDTAEYLERKGYQVVCATQSTEARELLQNGTFAAAVVDYRLDRETSVHDTSGAVLAREISRVYAVPTITLTKYRETDKAVEVLRPDPDGRPAAVDFVSKQAGLFKLLEAVQRITCCARLFLCYARPDRQAVEDLYGRLELTGMAPWMDIKCLIAGENWQLAIRQAIRKADFFIVCLTNNSVNRRGFMQNEIRIALDMLDEMLEQDIYVIPCRLDACKITHESLQALQWVELYQPDGFPSLLRAIQEGMLRRNRAIQFP